MIRNLRRSNATTPVGSWVNFNPLSLSPIAWFDASDSSTITSSSGAVSQWNDKSGNSLNVSQGTSTSQPTIVSNEQNGLAGMSFGGDDFLTYDAGSDALNFAPLTVFVVIKDSNSSQASNTYRRVMSMRRSATTTADYQAPNFSMGKDNLARTLGLNCNGVGSGNVTYPNNSAFLFSGSATNSSCSVQLGNSYSTSFNDAQVGSMRYFRLGSDCIASGNPPTFASHESWVGYIYEVLFFRQDMPSVSKVAVQNYLSKKWGVY